MDYAFFLYKQSDLPRFLGGLLMLAKTARNFISFHSSTGKRQERKPLHRLKRSHPNADERTKLDQQNPCPSYLRLRNHLPLPLCVVQLTLPFSSHDFPCPPLHYLGRFYLLMRNKVSNPIPVLTAVPPLLYSMVPARLHRRD